MLEDDWTVVSVDGSAAAHFEHTAAITPDGPWVTTAEDGGEAGFAAIGQAAEPGGGQRRARAAAGVG